MSEKTYDNRGRFAIFINDKKREGKKDADLKGTYTDESGQEYWMDAWRGKKADGSIYYSGSIKPKEARQGTPRPASRPAQGAGEQDDW